MWASMKGIDAASALRPGSIAPARAAVAADLSRVRLFIERGEELQLAPLAYSANCNNELQNIVLVNRLRMIEVVSHYLREPPPPDRGGRTAVAGSSPYTRSEERRVGVLGGLRWC